MSVFRIAIVLNGLVLALVALPCVAAPEPAIQAIVSNVSEAAATGVVTDLVALGTRYSGTVGCDLAADDLVAKLRSYGLDAQKEPFPWGALTLYNVRARHVGVVRPGETYLLVAHYDSTSEDPLVSAPGADDDASGVACVLEAARTMSTHQFEASVEFLLTGGEEQGLLGSDFDAGRREAAGETVAGVINHDMVAYWPTGWSRDLDVDGAPQSARIVDAYALAAADYVPGMAVEASLDWGVCGDDQVSYHVRAYPAIIVMDCHEAHMGMDGETTPHYHQTSDTIAMLDLPRMTQVAKATTAAAALLAVPIIRRLLREDSLTLPGFAGQVLRVGSPLGGNLTRIDPAGAGTTIVYNPTSPILRSGEGGIVGDGARGVLTFYETDGDERLDVARVDADADGQADIVLTFGS